MFQEYYFNMCRKHHYHILLIIKKANSNIKLKAQFSLPPAPDYFV